MAEPQDEPEKGWSDTVRPDPSPDAQRVADVLGPRQQQRAARRARRNDRVPPALAIALGIAALAVVVIIGITVVQWRQQVAAQEKIRLTNEAQRQAQMQAEQLEREALARQAQLIAEQQRQEEARSQAFAEQQRAADAARRAEADAADRKEKAWAKYYRPPPHCETAATMECTNRFIRAKREFEEKFAKGLL